MSKFILIASNSTLLSFCNSLYSLEMLVFSQQKPPEDSKYREGKIDFSPKQHDSFYPLQENSIIPLINMDPYQQKTNIQHRLDESINNSSLNIMDHHHAQNHPVAEMNQSPVVTSSPLTVGKQPLPDSSPYQNKPILDLLRMRSRTNISQENTAVLETAFITTPFPTSQTKVQLAQMTGLPEKVISVWFQNRRQRIRKESSFLP